MSYKKIFAWGLFSVIIQLPAYSINQVANKDKNIVLEQTKDHEFSALGKKDKFVIKLKGNNIINSLGDFKIISYEGKIIYNIDFKATDLLDIEQPAAKKSQEKQIIDRVKSFFTEKNFKKPAIDKNQRFDEDYAIKDNWYEIKTYSQAISFTYLLGYEDVRNIAYSKKKKKVVLFFNCC